MQYYYGAHIKTQDTISLLVHCYTFQADETVEDAAGSEKPVVDDNATTATTPTVMTAPTVEVDSNHPEVQSMVAAAVEVVEKQPVTLPPDVFLEVVEAAITDLEKDMRTMRPGGAL